MQHDLGSSRAEWTKTVDLPANLRPVDARAIEATRMANIPGTQAYKAAQRNKVKIDGWSSRRSDDPVPVTWLIRLQTWP